MKLNNVSNLILRKSTIFLRISVILFSFSMILVSVFCVLGINQYQSANTNFIENQNVHIIEITDKTVKQATKELNFDDLNSLKKQFNNSGNQITSLYAFNFGITDTQNVNHLIVGIDNNGYSFISKSPLNTNMLYSNQTTKNNIILEVPNINISDGGWTSSKSTPLQIENKKIDISNSPLNLYDENLNFEYVNLNTYETLIKLAYNLSWEEFQKKFSQDNSFGITAIKEVYINVKNIQNVDSIASKLEKQGYNIRYTFKSFNNFAGTINNTLKIVLILALFVLLTSVVYIILSFNQYFGVQQKDMGILKHFGYSTKQLDNIYSRAVNKIFVAVGFFIIIFTFILGYLFIQENWLHMSIEINILLLSLLFILNRLLLQFSLKRFTKRKVLYLINDGKEFE